MMNIVMGFTCQTKNWQKRKFFGGTVSRFYRDFPAEETTMERPPYSMVHEDIRHRGALSPARNQHPGMVLLRFAAEVGKFCVPGVCITRKHGYKRQFLFDRTFHFRPTNSPPKCGFFLPRFAPGVDF